MSRFCLRSATALLLFLCISLSAAAQDIQTFRVISATPQQGAVDVPTETTVSFTYDNPLPDTIDVDLISDDEEGGFIIPLNEFGVSVNDIDLSGDRRTVSFDVTQDDDTDINWIAFGIEIRDGAVRARPFVLSYTTADAAGPYEVSGTVTASLESGEAVSPVGTFIGLINEDDGEFVQAGVVEDASGAYTIAGLRDGSYIGQAVLIADALTIDEEDEGFYFDLYDADGDALPDPIVVAGSDVSGIDYTLGNIVFRTDTGGPEEARSITLVPNYPNPVTSSTTLSFELAQPGPVALTVYDVLGREVATLVNERLPAGAHSVEWRPRELPSGLYIYTLEAADTRLSRTLTLLK